MTPDKPDLERLIERLRKMAVCIYIAVEAEVAKDIADGLEKAAAALETLSARLEEAEALPCAIADWHCESDGCMANVPDKVAEAAKIYAANFHAWKERAEKAEQAAEEMRANLSALVSDVLSFKQYNITSRNDYTPGLRNAIAALAGKEGNNMQAALHQEKPQGRGR
jgi:uncharacterized protein (DUF885 family)